MKHLEGQGKIRFAKNVYLSDCHSVVTVDLRLTPSKLERIRKTPCPSPIFKDGAEMLEYRRAQDIAEALGLNFRGYKVENAVDENRENPWKQYPFTPKKRCFLGEVYQQIEEEGKDRGAKFHFGDWKERMEEKFLGKTPHSAHQCDILCPLKCNPIPSARQRREVARAAHKTKCKEQRKETMRMLKWRARWYAQVPYDLVYRALGGKHLPFD